MIIMKEGWTRRWKALFIWLCGYLSIVAFAITGGYAIVKSEDEELKKTAKAVLIVTLIFTAISMVLTLISSSVGILENGSSDLNVFFSKTTLFVSIAKIIVFAVCGAVSFFKKDNKNLSSTEQKTEEPATEEETKNA